MLQASVGNQQKFYISAQSPLPNTVHHFWQMIWESDVYLVVSLADTNDTNTVSYYHPAITDKPFETGEVRADLIIVRTAVEIFSTLWYSLASLISFQFQIWSQFSQETGHCVTTKLRVFHSSTRRVRGIWHLQYNEWINDGCPKDVAHFLGKFSFHFFFSFFETLFSYVLQLWKAF